jgi:Raf kinase inhibitor-like YbhB/YbcL family protein
MIRVISLVAAAVLCLAACQQKKQAEAPPQGETQMALTITSTASWSGVPEGTKSLAMISDDPDAPMGTWVHWVLFNVPPDTTGLPEKVPTDEVLPGGARHGITDFGRHGYGGPCPPSGTHRYYFKLYALDTVLDLSGKITKDDLLGAMEGHILAEGQLMGKYKRS